MTRTEALRAARARVYVYRRRHGEYVKVSPWDYRRPDGPLTEHAYFDHVRARRAAAGSVAEIALHLLGAHTDRAFWLIHDHVNDPNGTHDAPGLLCLALADAALVAAAPDLLAALQWALTQIDDSLDPDHQAALESARACVRRATGGA